MSLIISNNTSDLLAGFEIQFMNANSSNDLMLTTIMRFHHFFLVFFFFFFPLKSHQQALWFLTSSHSQA